MPGRDIFFRTYVAVNTVLLILSLMPWFGGTAEAPGAADRIFGWLRFGGFRFDFLWMLVAFLLTGVWTILNLITIREGRHRLTNMLIGTAWCFGFLFYLRHSLTSGSLDMG